MTTGKLKEFNTSRTEREKLKDKCAKITLEISRLNEKFERRTTLLLKMRDLKRQETSYSKDRSCAQLEESIQLLQKELKDPMTELISRLFNLEKKRSLSRI